MHTDATGGARSGQQPQAPGAPADLGPFSPPGGHTLEREFIAPRPRPIPPEVKQGRHARLRRKVAVGNLIAGVVLLLLSLVPVVRDWGTYVLPLAYLHWIGLLALAAGVFHLVFGRLLPGPYRHLRDGVPTVARIRQVTLRPAVIHNGQALRYRFVAEVDYQDPRTGETRTVETGSNDFAVTEKDKLDTSYRPGDYVTAVYLESDPAKTFRLYGFLDLKPGLGIVAHDHGAPPKPISRTLSEVAFLVLLVLAGFGNVHAYARYEPLVFSPRQFAPAFALGAVLLGGGLLAFLRQSRVRAERERVRLNQAALASGRPLEQPTRGGWFVSSGRLIDLLLIAGAPLLGGVTGMCWAFILNAQLDRSPAREQPARIEEMVMITHAFLFREFNIEYLLDGDSTKRKYPSRPAEMARFVGNDRAIAVVRDGRFGWPWVERLRPAPTAPR